MNFWYVRCDLRLNAFSNLVRLLWISNIIRRCCSLSPGLDAFYLADSWFPNEICITHLNYFITSCLSITTCGRLSTKCSNILTLNPARTWDHRLSVVARAMVWMSWSNSADFFLSHLLKTSLSKIYLRCLPLDYSTKSFSSLVWSRKLPNPRNSTRRKSS